MEGDEQPTKLSRRESKKSEAELSRDTYLKCDEKREASFDSVPTVSGPDVPIFASIVA